MRVNDVEVKVIGFDGVTEKEVSHYIDYIENETHEPLKTLFIERTADNKVALKYSMKKQKFERIRRITGYLVGTIDRWNNAKREEEHERVKHGVST